MRDSKPSRPVLLELNTFPSPCPKSGEAPRAGSTCPGAGSKYPLLVPTPAMGWQAWAAAEVCPRASAPCTPLHILHKNWRNFLVEDRKYTSQFRKKKKKTPNKNEKNPQTHL